MCPFQGCQGGEFFFAWGRSAFCSTQPFNWMDETHPCLSVFHLHCLLLFFYLPFLFPRKRRFLISFLLSALTGSPPFLSSLILWLSSLFPSSFFFLPYFLHNVFLFLFIKLKKQGGGQFTSDKLISNTILKKKYSSHIHKLTFQLVVIEIYTIIFMFLTDYKLDWFFPWMWFDCKTSNVPAEAGVGVGRASCQSVTPLWIPG